MEKLIVGLVVTEQGCKNEIFQQRKKISAVTASKNYQAYTLLKAGYFAQ